MNSDQELAELFVGIRKMAYDSTARKVANELLTVFHNTGKQKFAAARAANEALYSHFSKP